MKNPVLAVVVIVGLLFSGGCSPAEVESPTPVPSPSASPTTVSASPTPASEPSPTPEPSPEPTFTQELSPEQQEVYDLVHEHFTLHNELMKDPHLDWQPLINTVDGAALQEVLSFFGEMRTERMHRVGDEIFYLHEIADIQHSGAISDVVVKLCTDSGDSDVIEEETGESVMVERPLVLDWEAHVSRESGSIWMIDEFTNRSVESCGPVR